MAESPPTTDLRGGNASADSFTRSITSSVVAYAVDFQSDSLSGAAPGSMVRPEAPGRLPWLCPGTGTVFSASVLGSGKQIVAQIDLPGQERELYTVRFLATRNRRWQRRGTNPKVWGGFRRTGNSRIGLALTLDEIDFARCFASVSTKAFW